MKKINYPLMMGIFITTFLLFMFFFPDLFTDKDPLFEESPKYIEVKQDGEWVEEFGYNPMPPNKENIMGTDDAGRDVYARLVYGTRNTLSLVLMIAVLRMLIAFPLGLIAGMGNRLVSRVINLFNTFFTAIPILMISFVIFNFTFFKTLEMERAILYFAFVLTILGWAKLAGMIEDSTQTVMNEDFIEGEIAIGKTKFKIAYQNVLPHIIPDMISLFFKEIGMAMFLIAQLAVFNIFVGVARRVNALAFRANYEMILEPEWGGTLSRIAVNMRKFDAVYWMTLYPIFLFSISIVGFNLLGEGLRIEFQKKNSHMISYIRKLYYVFSPKLLVSQLKDIKTYYKPVLAKFIAVGSIIAYLIIPWNPSTYDFKLENSIKHLEELVKPEYSGRVSGSQGGYLSGEYIKEVLENYGYKIDEMDIPFMEDSDITPVFIEEGQIRVTDDSGEVHLFNLYEDFIVRTISRNVFDRSSEDRLIYKGFAANEEEAFRIPDQESLIRITNTYLDVHEHAVQGVTTIQIDRNNRLPYEAEFLMHNSGFNRGTVAQIFNNTSIVPFEELYELLSKGYCEVEIDLSYPVRAQNNGRNIIATLLGNEKTEESPGEIIIIGATYDGVFSGGNQSPYYMSATPAAIALEVARVLSLVEPKFDKTIQIIFWDNQSERNKSAQKTGIGQYHLVEQRDIKLSQKEGFYYLDVGYPGFNQGEKLGLTTMPAQRADGKNYLIGLEMEKRLKQMNIDYQRFHYDYDASYALYYMRLNATTSIGVGNMHSGGMNSPYDNMDNIDVESIEAIGQLIVDTVTMNPYLKTIDQE